jgi:hypothetical protein
MPTARLKELQRRQRELARQIAGLGFIQPGSVVLRHTYCQTPGCRCQADPPQLHGPYWQWTRYDAGRTITRRLTPRQAALYQEWIANRRRLTEIITQMEKLSEQAAELLLPEGPPQPNNGNIVAPNVLITDNLPTTLQVVSASSTQGTFTLDGGTVIFVVGTVNPNQVVTLKVVTKVGGSVIPPANAINTAILTWPGGAARSSNTVSVRITRGQLPSTGEHPDETSQSAGWLIIAGTLLGGLALAVRRKRRHVPE